MIKKVFPYVLLLLIPIIVLLGWYSKGKFIGGGEASLQLWDFKRYIDLNKSVWIERGLGGASATGLPKIPLLVLINLLPSFNNHLVHQIAFFFITISAGLIGVFFLTLEIIRDNDKKKSLVAAVFYLFNPYTVSQIFGRFIFAGIAAWGFLPLFLFFLLKWLRHDKKYTLVIVSLFFILISYVFSQPSYLLVYWPSAFLLLIAELLVNKKDHIRIFLRFTEFFLIWLIINIWWIYPYLMLSGAVLSGYGGFKYNYDSLGGVSKYSTLDYLLTLKQGYFIGPGGKYYSYYSQTMVVISSLTALAVAAIGLLSVKGKKYGAHLTIIGLAGLFISKGVNPPFGSIFYKFLFSNFPITYGLRNPYEKFGIVWLLVYSILYALGFLWFLNEIKKIEFKYIITLLLLVIVIFIGMPILDGSVFPKKTYISVPSYYENLNDFLIKDSNNGRVLLEPVQTSTGVSYSWGYNGIEPSVYLIDKPLVGAASVSQSDPIQKKLQNTSIKDDYFFELLKNLNISYIVFNNDYIYPESKNESVNEIKYFLENNSNFVKAGSFGAVDLYKFPSNGSGSIFEVQSENPPQISYVKKSPIEYQVSITNAESPYLLIFKTRYNNLWLASTGNVKLTDHNMIYDYANFWKIDKKGSYTIDIKFSVRTWNIKI